MQNYWAFVSFDFLNTSLTDTETEPNNQFANIVNYVNFAKFVNFVNLTNFLNFGNFINFVNFANFGNFDRSQKNSFQMSLPEAKFNWLLFQSWMDQQKSLQLLKSSFKCHSKFQSNFLLSFYFFSLIYHLPPFRASGFRDKWFSLSSFIGSSKNLWPVG